MLRVVQRGWLAASMVMRYAISTLAGLMLIIHTYS